MSPTNNTERPKPCSSQCRGHLAEAMKDIDLLLTPSALGEAPAGLSQYRRYLVQYPVDVDLYALHHAAGVYRTVRFAGRHSAHRSPKPGSPNVGSCPDRVPGFLEITLNFGVGPAQLLDSASSASKNHCSGAWRSLFAAESRHADTSAAAWQSSRKTSGIFNCVHCERRDYF